MSSACATQQARQAAARSHARPALMPTPTPVAPFLDVRQAPLIASKLWRSRDPTTPGRLPPSPANSPPTPTGMQRGQGAAASYCCSVPGCTAGRPVPPTASVPCDWLAPLCGRPPEVSVSQSPAPTTSAFTLSVTPPSTSPSVGAWNTYILRVCPINPAAPCFDRTRSPINAAPSPTACGVTGLPAGTIFSVTVRANGIVGSPVRAINSEPSPPTIVSTLVSRTAERLASMLELASIPRVSTLLHELAMHSCSRILSTPSHTVHRNCILPGA